MVVFAIACSAPAAAPPRAEMPSNVSPDDMPVFDRDEHGCRVPRSEFAACIPASIWFQHEQRVPAASDGPVLDAIAETMRLAYPDIELLEARGFRIADEPAEMSRERAAGVHAALVQRGVDPSRLVIGDGGVADKDHVAFGERRVMLLIMRQRIRPENADAVECTRLGLHYIKDARPAPCR
jgi:hypothetical protein